MGLLLLFVDGIGLGRDDRRTNPFAAIDARYLAPLAGRPPASGTRVRPLDATLGVDGLPQSATGQTTLLTGVNASAHLGHHQVGIPGPSLWPLLERESLFLKLVRAGASATFANAFTRQHLDARRPRWSASTRSYRAAGLPFRIWSRERPDVVAVSHDYTGDWMARRGIDVPPRTAAQAAAVLAELAATHDFVLYEYFLTDLAGHRGTDEEQLDQARRIEALLDALFRRFDFDRDQLLVTSDHGNLEDVSHRRHTMNPVPLLTAGPSSEWLDRRIGAMTDVTPAIVELCRTSAR